MPLTRCLTYCLVPQLKCTGDSRGCERCRTKGIPCTYPKPSNPRPIPSSSLLHTQSGARSSSASTSTSQQWRSPRVEQHQQHQEILESDTKDGCRVECEPSNIDGDLLGEPGWTFSQIQETDPVDDVARLWTDDVSFPLCLDEMSVQSPASCLCLSGTLSISPTFLSAPLFCLPSSPRKRSLLTTLFEETLSNEPSDITRAL